MDPTTTPATTSAPPAPGDPNGGLLGRLTRGFPRIDDTIYPIIAGACVLWSAIAFYRSMHLQTGGQWSAPLDDVFIHFDYARATARGYPFQWSEGNGFSSGNTSVLYPFVLALGYLIGFRDLSLMRWAAVIACVCTLGFLLAAASVTRPLGRWAKYILPPVVLSIGALDWSLWSGMENALHLGVWALCLTAALAVVHKAGDARAVRIRSWLAGLLGAMLFLTRPESVVCIAAFAVFVALAVRRTLGGRAAFGSLLRIGLPGAVALVAQAAANRVFTGEWSSAGAITKLALNNPYMTPTEKLDEYLFLLKYVVLRNTQHHFSSQLPWGWLVPLVAIVPLFKKTTRSLAVLLWVQVVGWLALVAMNGQVRWQNERYTMSAVAWLLVLAATGLGVIGASSIRKLGRYHRVLPLMSVAAIAALFWRYQAPNMRDQIWFFGRASRNIRDQHIVAGRVLAEMRPHRVLVGDAGALIYASDRSALDLIGLGGYHDLPFARAGVHGLGASLELIERMPEDDRPDVMAIYPTWWGDLPTLFGKRLIAIPVVGNVICGGAEKVLYRADWRALDREGKPATLRPDERVVDELDVADLVSERQHRYDFPHPSIGFIAWHVLADPADSKSDLFDAGRVIPPGKAETATLRAPSGRGRLIVRTTADGPASIEVSAAGQVIGKIAVNRALGWAEPSIDLPAGLPPTIELTIAHTEGDFSIYHAWVVELVER